MPRTSMIVDVRFGKHCIRADPDGRGDCRRVDGHDESNETVVSEYQLSVEQVRAALAYAAHVAAYVPPAVRQASSEDSPG